MSIRLISGIIFSALLIVAGVVWSDLSPKLTAVEGDINFSHKLHVGENEVECENCHASIATSESSADRNMPSMEDCGNCHDVDDDEQCGTCHKNADDPGGIVVPEREQIFNHKKHVEMDIACDHCHKGIESAEGPNPAVLPEMKICLECHDGQKAPAACETCHSRVTLADIHPNDWQHQHGDRASSDRQWCMGCHKDNDFCISCHRGDNLTGDIHDLNYVYTHGLDAKSKAADCGKCHENKAFCVACHESGNRMPLRHSTLSWGVEHGRYAREDVENCASCHEADDPTCARVGCHNDFDGIKGTDTPIHNPDAGQFDLPGPWHDDDGYYCYQCHVKTGTPGVGFCGYCHN